MEDFPHKNWETAEAAYDRLPCVRMMFLAPINQHAKRARNRLSLRMGILLRWSRSRTKIRGGQKKVVRLWIDIHRFGAKLDFDRFNFRELLRGILMKNVELPTRVETNNSPVSGSKTLASTPGLMGNDWMTLPLSASIMTRNCGLRPLENSRRCSRSISLATGVPAGATGQRALIVRECVSTTATSFFSSLLS